MAYPEIKDLTVRVRAYHPYADAWLIRAELPAGSKKPFRHIVGWQSRLGPQRLLTVRSFPDVGSAEIFFNGVLEKDDVPARVVEQPDRQKQVVYDWEEEHVIPYAKPILNKRQALKIIRQISVDYGIDRPKLAWGENLGHSDYDEDGHEIFFGEHNGAALMHEMAHGIVLKTQSEAKGPAHSPGFVWIAIELYSRYGQCDATSLMHSAAKAGILGDLDIETQIDLTLINRIDSLNNQIPKTFPSPR